jgi:cytochrome c oxidase assembly protein subunit 15
MITEVLPDLLHMESSWLHRYASLLAVCTLVLLAAGALVTSNEAGLSVPDWPLSYGKIMPEMTGGVLFEHGHRMVATFVGMLTIGLVIFLYRAESRRWLRKLGLAALGAVIVQGVLGGLTVILLLPPAVSVSHACLAQLFFSTTVAIAVFTSKSWQQGPEPVFDQGWPSLRSLAVISPVLVLAQIALGAAFRHRAIGVIPHIIGAMVVSFALLLIAVFVLHQFPGHHTLRSAAKAVLGVILLQVALGVAALWARISDTSQLAMVVSTVAHVVGGGLTMASTIVLSLQILRNVRSRVAEMAPGQTQAVAS